MWYNNDYGHYKVGEFDLEVCELVMGFWYTIVHIHNTLCRCGLYSITV